MYLNTKQAAEVLGVHPRTIVEWIHRGRLRADRNPSERGRFRILAEDLDEATKWEKSSEDQS